MRYELTALLIALLILLAYYIVVWLKVGKDPPKRSIMPLYEVPEGLSPSAMRYIRQMCFDNQCFVASLIDMAIKGVIKIDENAGFYTISRVRNTFSVEEYNILDGLLHGRNSIRIVKENGPLITFAWFAAKKYIEEKYKKQYFSTNRIFLVPGVLITLFTLAGTYPEALVWFIWISGWIFGVDSIISYTINSWNLGGKRGVGCIILFLLPFIALMLFGLYIIYSSEGLIFTLVLLITTITHFIFYKLLPAPTKEGRAVLDKIEGFREYLSVAESDNLDPAIFEKFLPYALALNVELAWSRKFFDAFERTEESIDKGGYTPMWYSGSMAGYDAGRFLSAIYGSLSSALRESLKPIRGYD